MYHSHFGLDEQAFSIAVNPRYLYMSAQHKEALAHLLYGVNSGGFVMLSGEVGTGKTTTIRCLLEQLPDTADVAFVMNPSASAPDLLSSICDEFGVRHEPNEKNIKLLTDDLTAFLLKNHSEGRKSIVMIDEAQLLRVSTLEQVRLLTNLETNTEKLLQIILVGQPELNELLAKPALRQLSQRITARYHLRPLAEAETDAYIKHRLNVAGLPASRNPFPPKIVAKIHRISRGIPRLVNVLCDRMLLGVYSKGTTEVDNSICNQAIVEVLGGDREPSSASRANSLLYIVLAGCVVLVAVLLWLLISGTNTESDSALATDPASGFVSEQVAVVSQPLNQIKEEPLSATEAASVSQVALDEYWYYLQADALRVLLDTLGIEYIGADLCRAIQTQNYSCETKAVSNWGAVLELNRPAVLTITTSAKQLAHVVLVGLSGSEASILVNEQVLKVSLRDLGSLWTGELVYTWYKPEDFSGAIAKGDRGPMVAWVAQQFAILDKQERPMTTNVFSQALKKRVEIFQRRHGLKDDGVVGLQTVLEMNKALGLDKTLGDFAPVKTGGL